LLTLILPSPTNEVTSVPVSQLNIAPDKLPALSGYLQSIAALVDDTVV
jgi:hypothetical protein